MGYSNVFIGQAILYHEVSSGQFQNSCWSVRFAICHRGLFEYIYSRSFDPYRDILYTAEDAVFSSDCLFSLHLHRRITRIEVAPSIRLVGHTYEFDFSPASIVPNHILPPRGSYLCSVNSASLGNSDVYPNVFSIDRDPRIVFS